MALTVRGWIVPKLFYILILEKHVCRPSLLSLYVSLHKILYLVALQRISVCLPCTHPPWNCLQAFAGRPVLGMLVNNVEAFKTALRNSGWREARLEDTLDTNSKPNSGTELTGVLVRLSLCT